MHAVKDIREKYICFIAGGRPTWREGLIVEEGAWIDIPPNLTAWPPETKRPEQVLCKSIDDPLHYKLFKYRDEITDDFEETGLNFGGTFSSKSWEKFDERSQELAKIRGEGDD